MGIQSRLRALEQEMVIFKNGVNQQIKPSAIGTVPAPIVVSDGDLDRARRERDTPDGSLGGCPTLVQPLEGNRPVLRGVLDGHPIALVQEIAREDRPEERDICCCDQCRKARDRCWLYTAARSMLGQQQHGLGLGSEGRVDADRRRWRRPLQRRARSGSTAPARLERPERTDGSETTMSTDTKTNTPTTPTTTEINPTAKTLAEVIKAVNADNKVTVPELREVANTIKEDGVVTNVEKDEFKTVYKQAIKDNPDASSRTEIMLITQSILTTKELFKDFMIFVGAVFGLVILWAVIDKASTIAVLLGLG